MGNKQKSEKRARKRSYKNKHKHMMEVVKKKKLMTDNIMTIDNYDTAGPSGTNIQDSTNQLLSPSKHNVQQESDQIANHGGDSSNINNLSSSVEHSLHQELNQMANYEVAEEERVTEKNIIGRRIVNVSHFFGELQKISSHGPLNCGLQSVEIISERLTGLMTKLTLKCRLCNLTFVIDGDNSPEEMNLNTCAVAGAIAAGCGHNQLQEITSTMGLPEIWPKLYNFHMNIVNKKWESELLKSMNEAAEEERRAAVEEGRVNAAGIAIIDVIADGCWAKRSYQKNYSSLSGAAAIIGKRTNKILYMAVKNKFCCICAQAENKRIPANDHVCYKNYAGPSTGMESKIIVEGFKKSIEMHNLIYGRIISDGDANTYSKLLQDRPYENLTVEKIECRNHLLRNFCNKLQNLITDTKFLIRFRKLITKKRILSMRKVVVSAIAKHKNTDNPMQLHNDIILAADHAFGHHTMCKEYFCSKRGAAEDIEKDLYTNSLWQKIKLILSQLAAHSRSLLHDVDSNSVERYHSIVAKFVGGKRINFVQKYQYKMRCNAAALSFNTKKPLSLLHKSIVGRSPKGKIHQLERRRIHRSEKYRKNIEKYTKNRKRVFENKIDSSANYGEDCTKPDMPSQMMEEAKKLFVQNLKKNEDERRKIERDTILQSDSSEWLELRRNLLTASNFGKIIKRRNDISCSNMVKDLIYKKPIDHVKSIIHGREKEAIAKEQLEKEKNIKIQACGLFLDEKIPFLGASPDGIIDSETICEIKCPITAHKSGLDKAISDKKITFYKKSKDGNYIINKDHNWYYQIQGQLHITKKQKCLFGLWSGEDVPIKTEIIFKDDTFWETKMEKKLILFYTECIPELIDPRLPRKIKIRDPDYITQAISMKKNKKEGKENTNLQAATNPHHQQPTSSNKSINQTIDEEVTSEEVNIEYDEPRANRICRDLNFFEL